MSPRPPARTDKPPAWCSVCGRPLPARAGFCGQALRTKVGCCTKRVGARLASAPAACQSGGSGMQARNGAKVFAEATQPARSGKGVKTQIGRWKGLDEDISDDQVTRGPSSTSWRSPACPSYCQHLMHAYPVWPQCALGLACAQCWSAAVHSALCLPCYPLLSQCSVPFEASISSPRASFGGCAGASMPDASFDGLLPAATRPIPSLPLLVFALQPLKRLCEVQVVLRG